jgi:hypothetical protein
MNVTFYNFTLTVINSIVTTYIFVGLMEFNATFNIILAILWWSVLLVGPLCTRPTRLAGFL